MVVVVHTTALYKYSYGEINNIYWCLSVFLDSASRMCVPIFFMISGYIFLLHKEVKVRNLVKIFTALTFYSVLCVIYWYIFHGRDFISGILQIYAKPALYHLWFMFYIFSFYLMFMFMSAKEITPQKGVVIIVAIYLFLNWNMNEIFQMFGVNYRNNFVISAYHLQLFLYCFAGAFIGSLENSRAYLMAALWLCVISILAIFVLTVEKSFEAKKLNPIFQAYTSIPVFFSAITMFYIVKCKKNSPFFDKVARKISELSLSIYGVHAIYLEIIRSKKMYLFDNPLLNLLFTTITVFFLSYLTAWVIKKIDRKGYVS
ncbi:hypothetical protein CDT99_18940 [Cronobacter sakazakii]|nr:hypothetical protein CDT99_18940 [Cronobacter sakazakii]